MKKTNFKTEITAAAEAELRELKRKSEMSFNSFGLEIKQAKAEVELASRIGEFLDGCDSVSAPKPEVKIYRDGTKGTTFQSEWMKGRSSGYISWGSSLEWESRNKSRLPGDTEPTGWWWGDEGMVGGGTSEMKSTFENSIPRTMESFLDGRYSKRWTWDEIINHFELTQ